MTEERSTLAVGDGVSREQTILSFMQSGSGPWLIWGHGLTSSIAAEDQLGILDWPAISCRVLRYDALGHGMSDSSDVMTRYSWSELAADQAALADALGISEYVAGGASMGCGTALHAAVQYPGRIKALVLQIPPTGWEARAAQLDEWDKRARLVESEGIDAAIARQARTPPPDPLIGDDRRNKIRADRIRSWSPQAYARVMRGAAHGNLPTRPEVARITVPALILAWTGDPVHPASVAQELAGLMPRAQLHIASTATELATWTSLINEFIKDI